MITRERIGEAFEATDPDELVHDMTGEETASINNGGIDAQIDYLLENG